MVGAEDTSICEKVVMVSFSTVHEATFGLYDLLKFQICFLSLPRNL